MEIKQDVFGYRFTNGMLIWPILRYTVTESEAIEHIVIDENCHREKKWKIVWKLFRNLRHIGIKKKGYITYITSTLFNIRKKGESFYENTLDDYYFNVFPNNSVIYEYPDRFDWRFPKKNRDTYTTLFYIELLSHFLSRMYCVFKSKNKDVSSFIESFPNCNLSYLHRYNIFLSIHSFLLNKLFEFSKPKLLVINCGCYGLTNAVVIFIAKKHGVKVAEIQHGVPSKVAYLAHHEVELSTEHSGYYPDYILTFGDYWNKYFTLPIKCVAIGHPYLCSYMNAMQCNEEHNTPAILFVSQPNETQKLLDIAISLRNQSKIKILFRLHPMESLTDEIKLILEKYSIELSDTTTDLYSEFCEVTAICGVYSTCLYEAKAFGLNVFFLDTKKSRAFMDTNLGVFINNSDELLEHLNDEYSTSSKDSMWKSGFSENYASFLKSEIFTD